MKRLGGVTVLMLLIAPSVALAQPGYLTILMQRALWAQADQNCQVLPGALTAEDVAIEMQARNIPITSDATLVFVHDASQGRVCQKSTTLYETWQDMQRLRDVYGWVYESAGQSKTPITKLTPSAQYADSCGTLPTFQSQGFDRAWGLFAYPGNSYNTTVQTNIIQHCFAYGRRYLAPINNMPVPAPYFQNTYSVVGGACNDSSLVCYNLKVPNASGRYRAPSVLVGLMHPAPGQWSVVQMYKFVDGSRANAGDGTAYWDCTSPDWRAHYTSIVELYCWTDFLAALDQRSSDAVITDPTSVAEAYGRIPS